MNPNKQKWIAKTYFYMITTYFKFIQLMVTMYIRVFEKSVQSHPGWRYYFFENIIHIFLEIGTQSSHCDPTKF